MTCVPRKDIIRRRHIIYLHVIRECIQKIKDRAAAVFNVSPSNHWQGRTIPQTDGKSTIIKKDQTNWPNMVDSCLFVYRTTYNRALNEIPFYVLYGRDPRLPQDL